MKSLIAFAFALALMNVANAALPASGQFVVNFFGTDSFCTGSQDQTILPVAASNCWDLTNTFGVYVTATDYINNGINVSSHASNCTDEITANTTLVCDGTCATPDSANYMTCNYSNFPSTGLTNYTSFTDSNCTTVGLDSVVYNATTQVCWTLDGSDSAFPTDYNSTSMVASILSYTDTTCGGFTSASGTAGSLVCDGTCQPDIYATGSYQCSYSNSAKLVASLIVTFALMLILA